MRQLMVLPHDHGGDEAQLPYLCGMFKKQSELG